MQRVVMLIILILASTGCNDSVEEPNCDLFVGSASISGVVHDFDGAPFGGAEVEFTISKTTNCVADFERLIGQGQTDQDGNFEVLLQSGNTTGVRCVFGRVAGSDSISAGRVKFTSDCRPTEPIDNLEMDLVATPSAVIPADLKIMLYRLHAHSGPHYSVSVLANGYVEYEGIYDVAVEGFADTTVDLTSVARLYREFELIDYWEFDESYPREDCNPYVYDVHYATTWLTADGREHSVSHDHGCYGIPELGLLTPLECKIDSVLNTIRWTGACARPCGDFCPPSN